MIETNKVYEMEALELLKQLPDESVDLILTDPPYNINAGKSTDYGFNEFDNQEQLYKEYFRVLKNDSFMVFTIRLSEAFKIYPIIEKSGFCFYRDLFWNKNRMSDCFTPIPFVHENILVFRKGSCVPNKLEFEGEEYTRTGKYKEGKQIFSVGMIGKDINVKNKKNRKANTLIDLDREYIIDAPNKTTMKYKERTEHPTQKPLKLWKVLLGHFSKQGDVVLDCFVGSGTTAIASLLLGRNFICCDNNKDYVAIANKRLTQQSVADFTSATPTLAKPKEFNMGLEVSATLTPKSPKATSFNLDLIGDF
jgi:site-specific DNA-methyltransferase (adenine-specific)